MGYIIINPVSTKIHVIQTQQIVMAQGCFRSYYFTLSFYNRQFLPTLLTGNLRLFDNQNIFLKMLYYKPLIFFAYRLKCNCFPGSRLLRIALKYERIKFEISHQKFSDKHFRLSNQDGIIAKKGVVNKSTMSSYGLNGKTFLQGCKGFYFC